VGVGGVGGNEARGAPGRRRTRRRRGANASRLGFASARGAGGWRGGRLETPGRVARMNAELETTGDPRGAAAAPAREARSVQRSMHREGRQGARRRARSR